MKEVQHFMKKVQRQFFVNILPVFCQHFADPTQRETGEKLYWIDLQSKRIRNITMERDYQTMNFVCI